MGTFVLLSPVLVLLGTAVAWLGARWFASTPVMGTTAFLSALPIPLYILGFGFAMLAFGLYLEGTVANVLILTVFPVLFVLVQTPLLRKLMKSEGAEGSVTGAAVGIALLQAGLAICAYYLWLVSAFLYALSHSANGTL